MKFVIFALLFSFKFVNGEDLPIGLKNYFGSANYVYITDGRKNGVTFVLKDDGEVKKGGEFAKRYVAYFDEKFRSGIRSSPAIVLYFAENNFRKGCSRMGIDDKLVMIKFDGVFHKINIENIVRIYQEDPKQDLKIFLNKL